MTRRKLPVWCAAALLLIACGGGGNGTDTGASGEVAETADVQAGADVEAETTEDVDEPLPEDLLPEIVDPDLTDTVDPETDSIEPDSAVIWPDNSDIPEDIFCESPPMYPDNCEEVSDFQCGFEAQCSDGTITIMWHEHIFCGDVEEIVDYQCTYECPGECDEAVSEEWLETGEQVVLFCQEEDPCTYPDYSTDCSEVDYFQCGVDAQCTGDQITVQWHEHVFCPGQEVEDIVDYSCTYDCKCDPETFIDWPEDGAQMVADYCLEAGCAPPDSYPLVPLGALAADPDAFKDTLVAVEGLLTAGANAMCTLAECTPEDPCCNGCDAAYTFAGEGSFITIVAGDVSKVGCEGTNCDFLDNCTPFALDQSHLLWGGFQYDNGIGTIYLDGFCKP